MVGCWREDWCIGGTGGAFLVEGWDLAVEEEEPSVQESINQGDRRETRLISLLSFLWITISPYIELIRFLLRK